MHIVFWLYNCIIIFHQKSQGGQGSFLQQILDTGSIFVCQMLICYFMLYCLLPKYLAKEKIILFISFVFIYTILASFLQIGIDYITHTYILGFKKHYGTLVVWVSTLVAMTGTLLQFGVIAIVHYYYQKSSNTKLLEKERLETELNFLKAQINPHFLFNALNSIYVLMKDDIKLSEQTLLKFSSLLRYQLYDCSSNETDLERETEFLNDYIALERIRNSENRIVNFNIINQTGSKRIAPFILLPFVENAFKHISHFNSRVNTIDITLEMSGNHLHFIVINTFEDNTYSKQEDAGGIGLQNVKRRLALLYPNKHILEIDKQKNIFTAKLNIELDGN